jgi:hypothetical protein
VYGLTRGSRFLGLVPTSSLQTPQPVARAFPGMMSMTLLVSPPPMVPSVAAARGVNNRGGGGGASTCSRVHRRGWLERSSGSVLCSNKPGVRRPPPPLRATAADAAAGGASALDLLVGSGILLAIAQAGTRGKETTRVVAVCQPTFSAQKKDLKTLPVARRFARLLISSPLTHPQHTHTHAQV